MNNLDFDDILDATNELNELNELIRLDEDIDISILDTSDEEDEIKEEPELTELLRLEQVELEELRLRAKALGVKNTENMDNEELEERVQVMLKVRLEGLSRLEFDDNQQLIPSLENLRILQIEAVQPKHSLRRADVLEKLQGYRLLTNKLNTTNNRWTRYIDKDDGFLRAGGFPIRNKPEEEFIVFKNVSKKFTFSIKREKVILMEKLPQSSMLLLSDAVLGLVSEFRDVKPDGNQFVVVSDDFNNLWSAPNNTQIARLSGLNRGGLGKSFRLRKVKYKNAFIFKLSQADKEELQTRLDNLSEEDKIGNRGIPLNLLQVIDRYYPN